MKRSAQGICLLILLLNVIVFCGPRLSEAAPNLINYQGELTDSGGAAVPDGSYSMVFRIFDVAAAGTPLWEESQSVTTAGGVYNVLLGSGTTNPSYGTFDASLFSADNRWLEVEVNGEILTPRQRITSGAFSLQAQEAAHALNADTANGTVANGISTTMIQDAAVGTQKLGDSAVTGAKIADSTITSAKIVGGAGSGLDADLLDGQHASAFAAASHNHDTVYYTKSQVDTMLAARDATIASLQGVVTALQAKLQYVSVNGTEMHITGANLHIESGTGVTNGAVNGVGNLIIGYNELRGTGDVRTGSHNLIIGRDQNYSSYGGLVAGYYNTVSGPYASVSGGIQNTASAFYSSVSGGLANTASGQDASVSGGIQNTASGPYSSVSGGKYNTASGSAASVVGGGGSATADGNLAFANYSAILGGQSNATGDPALVDHTLGQQASVSGGDHNTASGARSSVSGGSVNTASGAGSSVVGGAGNRVSAWLSSIIGGSSVTVDWNLASVLGDSKTYAVSATSTTEQTVVTNQHGLCALTLVKTTANDAGTNRWCSLTENADHTWTLGARTGSGATTSCKAICF